MEGRQTDVAVLNPGVSVRYEHVPQGLRTKDVLTLAYFLVWILVVILMLPENKLLPALHFGLFLSAGLALGGWKNHWWGRKEIAASLFASSLASSPILELAFSAFFFYFSALSAGPRPAAYFRYPALTAKFKKTRIPGVSFSFVV